MSQVEFSYLKHLGLQRFQISDFDMAAYTYVSCVCSHVYVGMCTYTHMSVEARG